MAPLNPAFINYTKNVSAGKSVSELVPPPTLIGNDSYEISPQNGDSLIAPQVSLPSSFDLRTYNKVTPVEDQDVNGQTYYDCWAFATYGSLESNLMPNQEWNFSENNLINTNGFDIPQPNGGGDMQMSTAYLTRWSGPVLASQDPYYNPISPSGLPPQVHVQNVSYIPPRQTPSDNNNIKTAIYDTMTGLYSGIYWNLSYLNPNGNGAYFYNVTGTPASANHAITIVGWDDNYAASNFAPLTPPGPGAFICKDSLGTGSGTDDGYLYISYYDNVIGTNDNAIFTAEPITNYDNNYQYDLLGWDGNLGYKYPNGSMNNYAYMGAIYNTNNNPVNNGYEYVDAVGFYNPYTTNANYAIDVYANPQSGDPASGNLVSWTSGTVTGAGFYTAKLYVNGLYYPAIIPHGDTFSVVLYLQTPSYDYPISIQYPLSGYASKATAQPGETFISPDGVNWEDTTQYNSSTAVCLKAYTENNIIENGGFEQNMNDWSTWTNGATGTVMVVSNESYNGQNSLLINESNYQSGDFGVNTLTYNATPGNTTLIFYVKNNSKSPPGTVYAELEAFNSLGAYIGGNQWSLTSAMQYDNWTNQWAAFDEECDLPAGTTKALVGISVFGNENLNFDDFELFRSDLR
jgi:C1A family cysteine protease